MRESDIEDYLVRRAAAMGIEVRKVSWVGRRDAPDRVLMVEGDERAARLLNDAGLSFTGPGQRAVLARRIAACYVVWVELKNPKTVLTFPADPHERAQAREHERMRAVGQRVEVIGTLAQVDQLLKDLR